MDYLSASSYTRVINIQKWSGFYGLKYLVFSMYYRVSKLMQRMFKCGEIQNTILTSDKEMNILIY